jgi:hypothetical protein
MLPKRAVERAGGRARFVKVRGRRGQGALLGFTAKWRRLIINPNSDFALYENCADRDISLECTQKYFSVIKKMRVRSTQLYCIVYRLKNALSKVHFCVQTPRRSLGYFGLRSGDLLLHPSLKEPS